MLMMYTWSSTYDLCDLQPAALTTTKEKYKQINNKPGYAEGTHNPGEEANKR
jgi:hypothetical protein